MEWSQIIDVSDRVSFHVPYGHRYINEFVVYKITWDEEPDEPWDRDHWFMVVYDGWDKRSGSSKAYQLPENWDVL